MIETLKTISLCINQNKQKRPVDFSSCLIPANQVLPAEAHKYLTMPPGHIMRGGNPVFSDLALLPCSHVANPFKLIKCTQFHQFSSIFSMHLQYATENLNKYPDKFPLKSLTLLSKNDLEGLVNMDY